MPYILFRDTLITQGNVNYCYQRAYGISNNFWDKYLSSTTPQNLLMNGF